MRISDWSSDVCSSDLVNSAAVSRPEVIAEIADRFGSQCVVASVDARRVGGGHWEIFTHGGRRATGIDALAHAARLAGLGAGELLVTSMDGDGTRQGYDLALTRAIADSVSVPVIASGGVRSEEHTSELQSLMRISYAVFCLKKKNT